MQTVSNTFTRSSIGSTRMGDIDRWKGNDRKFDNERQRKSSFDDDGYRYIFLRYL